MWMEEHIGKRVNHERVEEALDTCASKIATGCPFCRVMMTDGVDDVAAANGVPKAEVLDVAQLLLGSSTSVQSLCPRRARPQRLPRGAQRASRHQRRRSRTRRPSRLRRRNRRRPRHRLQPRRSL
jgi:hypothetical protein